MNMLPHRSISTISVSRFKSAALILKVAIAHPIVEWHVNEEVSHVTSIFLCEKVLYKSIHFQKAQ